MVRVRIIGNDGVAHDLDLPADQSLMEGAVRAGVDGIDADCGGQLACATCHVKIMPDWYDMLPPPNTDEQQMLEFAIDVADTSRLSCQVVLDSSLDGLVVTLPERQS